MKNTMTAVAAVTLAMTITACSGEATETEAAGLEGTWRVNIESAEFEDDSNSYLIADGQYTCNSCLPPYSVAADGEWQSVDRPGLDGVKIAVVDDFTVSAATRMGEEELGNSTWTVSEDGQSMTIEWTSLDGDEVVEGSTMYTRIADAPEGAHAVSGDWSVSGMGEMSEAGLTFSYTIDGDTITSSGNGGGYTATLGGEAVTPEGDETGGLIAVEQVSDNVYRETYSRDGEVFNITELTVDGDTLSGSSSSPRDGSSVTWTATRQ